ncbi:MAG: PIN domain-containing protein [Boseongicola sp. SB0662_bin_57]|nr:PIN domain-containing protein [Boseongicola sp. SB0662_bin_57]
MSHVADRFVVLLDANVLYPFRKRDVLLRFYDAGLFRARWTERVLDEWSRSLLKAHPNLKSNVEAQQDKIRDLFPEAIVSGFEHLEAGLNLPDADDRHVLAAAILCGAQHIVTDNIRDFPSAELDQFDIKAIEADEFLSRTFDLYKAEAMRVLRELRSHYSNPPFTPSEFVFDLTAKGMPKLAARVRKRRDFL